MKTINRLLIVPALLIALMLAGCTPKLRVGELQAESQSVELGSDASVRAEINMGAGDLKVTGGAEKLLDADFTYNVAELKPEVKFTKGTLVIWEPGKEGRIDWQGIGNFRNEWSLRLNDEIPMDLRVELGAGSGNLKLAGLSLTNLDVRLGAGEYMIDLSGNWANDLNVTINTGAANTTLKLPSSVGVRVEVDPGPNVINTTGLTQDGKVYTNVAYGKSAVTMQVHMEPGIGQINLNVEEVDEHAQAQVTLQKLLDQQVKQQNILGIVMSARLADGTVIWGTSGSTNPSGEKKWTADTPSLIASVTKNFTAVVVMQLVEEGKLSLDDTVDTWFPEQPNGDKITVRMLLSHTSGLAGSESTWGTDLDKWSRDWTPEELIAEANKAGAVGEPGSKVAHYSNTNYIMLGRIIEKVTGNSWEHEVETRIIQPLGLENTTFMKKDLWNAGVVSGYKRTSDGYLNLLEDPWYSHVSVSTAWAAGGIVSSASDLVTFASAFFDGKLVSKETLAVMTQPLATGDGRTWALGGGVLELNGRTAFGMGGDTTGYHAFFIGIPDTKLIVAALINTNEGEVISPSMAFLENISQASESK